jgi:hypothetical protein
MDVAEHGYKMLLSWEPTERIIGLKNVIVYGRAVTNVLQKLRSLDSSFDTWYKKYQTEMQSDPLLRYFYRLRSEVLKEGKLVVSREITNGHINPQLISILFPKPFNGVKFFICDKLGGSGWEIYLSDGTIGKQYVDFPDFWGKVNLRFSDAPKMHLGNSIKDNTVQSLARLYLNYLENIVRDAFQKFEQKEV